MCEFCPNDGGMCVVCNVQPAVDEIEHPTPEEQHVMKVQRLGRESGERGEDYRDNPYRKGSVDYFMFGGAQDFARQPVEVYDYDYQDHDDGEED